MSIIKTNSVILFLAVLSSSLLSGCMSQPTMYYWGEYEGLIYSMYTEPGTAEPKVQIEKLTTDIQQAKDSGKKTPPGVHAHLGFMYAAEGNSKLAKEAFAQEKAMFPESSKFIDGMMKRALKREKS